MAEQLVRAFEKIQKPLLCLYKKPKKELSSYGVPKISDIRGKFADISDKLVQISDIVEKPEKNPPSSFALVGKYILTKEVFYYFVAGICHETLRMELEAENRIFPVSYRHYHSVICTFCSNRKTGR